MAHSQQQRKNILKTVVLIIIFMVSVLLLFLNKITTPRYLSKIELKINKLELIQPAQSLIESGEHWQLVTMTAKQGELLAAFFPQLRKNIQQQTKVTTWQTLTIAADSLPFEATENIGILNPQGELVAYLKGPFDTDKMLLTFSSLVTHY